MSIALIRLTFILSNMSETASATATSTYTNWAPVNAGVHVQYDDSEDQLVDLSTGSLAPVDLQSWTVMTQLVEKLDKI